MKLTWQDHRDKIARVISDEHGIYTDAFKLALHEMRRRLDAAEVLVRAANDAAACTCSAEDCASRALFRFHRSAYESIVREQG